MKRRILNILSVVSALLIYGNLTAQELVRDGNIIISVNAAEQRGDMLYLDMDVIKEGTNNASTNNSIELIPMLVSGSVSKAFPAISIKGRNNYAVYARSLSMMSSSQRAQYEKSAPFAVLPDYRSSRDIVNYKVSIPYEQWMSSAHIELHKDDCGCGKVKTTNVKMLANKIGLEKVIVVERYVFSPTMAYVTPDAESVKSRVEECEAILDFPNARSELILDRGNNRSQMDKILSVLDGISSEQDISMTGVKIVGYASPEGGVAFNQKLSEDRARSLMGYLVNRYRYPSSFYSVEFGGEDWAGLVKALEQGRYSYSSDIINIISSNYNPVTRKSLIQSYRSGVPYREMLHNIYPSFRRVVFQANYNVKNYDLAEARSVAKKRPQNLSLSELFMVANSYEKGSDEYKELFEIAAILYPNDPASNLNAGVVAIERKDYVKAERYLSKVLPSLRGGEYDNAMGVLYMMRDNDLDKAEIYFRSALESGVMEAAQNLSELDKMRQSVDDVKKAQIKQAVSI